LHHFSPAFIEQHPETIKQIESPQKKERFAGNGDFLEEIGYKVRVGLKIKFLSTRPCLQDQYLSPTIFDLFSQLIMI